MKLLIKRFLSVLMIGCFSAGFVFSAVQPVFAAGNNVFNPTFTYNQQSSLWDIEWVPIDGTETVTVQWHEPENWHEPEEGEESSGNQVTITETLKIAEGKNSISLPFRPDHIYDLSFSFQNDTGKSVNFRNKYNEQVSQETVFFLSDMTFEGTSFNDVAVLGGVSDGNPYKETNDKDDVIRVISGQKPQITLRWKVPTIWQQTETEPEKGEFLSITHNSVDLNRLESGNTPHVDIDYAYFHVQMNEVKNIITSRNYRTTEYATDDGSKQIIVRETNDVLEGFDPLGGVEHEEDFVSFTLDQDDGIIPGTEYEKINIRLFFWNNEEDEQAIFSRLVCGFETNRGFPIENKDNVFQNIEGRIDSLFTPMMFDVSKVDVDKLEIGIYKIQSRNYNELYYQVQDAGTIIELLEGTAELSNGIKVPDASIPSETGRGSVIIEIPLDQNGQHPEHYYRVVVTDGNSHTPLGSLAIDLRILGNDTGKPPVPREIEVQPIYNGKQNVVYENPLNNEDIRIPTTNLRLSFEKPLLWRMKPWAEIQAEPDDENDFTFHVLVNTYLSDDVKMTETKVIGDEEVTVFVPVKEKRVLTFDKHDLQEDPNNSSRLIYTRPDPENSSDLIDDIDGTELFYDFASDKNLDDDENDVDTDMNGRGDYPTFLVPNTTYYLRMFSTRRKDSDDICWATQENLGERISYISPVVSFTTYPNMDLPVPLPNLELDVDIEPEPDPVTGKPVFNGITVDFPKILDDNDWPKYTSIMDNRKIVYDLYISESTDEDSFELLEPPYMETLETLYPDEFPNAGISTKVTCFPVGEGEPLKPNTTYYFKMRARLFVNGEADPFVISDETPIKSITTPKTDSGKTDDLDRKPRTPVEFSIATDENGQLELTDAKVTLNWLHAEENVTYEMVCTQKRLDTDAEKEDYIQDDYHIGDDDNPGFLDVYEDYKPDAADTELHIDVLDTPLEELGFTYNEGYTRVARFPINERFLKPNHLYYFSIRAVRNRGTEDVLCSDWVSIPVTTRMVAPPDFLEAVNDVQLGFKVRLSGNVNAEDIGIELKKGYQSANSWVELNRSQYSVVRDGRDYYIRLFDLEANTWYDVQPYYTQGDRTIWYDSDEEDWSASDKEPIQMKTRNTLNEIEVRFAGETLYDYYIEVRTDHDDDYTPLQYDRDEEDSDYGYTLADGKRIEFYREKTAAYVADGLDNKYVYYAKISKVRQRKSDGTDDRLPLLTNTRYYIKAWAKNIEDSAHIGPVTVRTDFSQDDYDRDHMEDEITDMFETKADSLTQKLYFTVNEPDKYANRILLKGAMVSNRMKMAGHRGVIVNITKEKPETTKDIILIPMEILTTLQQEGSRLTIQLNGGELTLTEESYNLDNLKQIAGTTGAKEVMLELTIDRKKDTPSEPSWELTLASTVFDIGIGGIGLKRTYAQMNEIIYDILKEPDATGPFQYGIINRELVKLLEDEKTLTYLSQADLENLIIGIIDRIEEELSLYIKDILDGGRGFSASVINRKDVPGLTGGLKLKMLYTGYEALAEPWVIPAGQSSWQEPQGVKAWVFPYLLITCKVPGQYAVFLMPEVTVPEEDGYINPEFQRLGQKYNLQKVFGTRSLYPGDLVSSENAVNLFEVITDTGDEVIGLSTQAKIRWYHLQDILPASVLQPNINREQAASLVVEVYAHKTGISSDRMRPTTFTAIKNADSMSDGVYHRMVIALDLGITSLEQDNSYHGQEPVTVGELINEVITVLELLGEW